VIAIAIFLERLFYFHRARIDVGDLLFGLRNLIKNKAYAEALSECAATPGPAARVIHSAIRRYSSPRTELREIVQESGQLEVPKLEKHLAVLLTVAQAVAACRYPPDGNRSFGPVRAALYGGRGYAAGANREIACIAMIETREALANLDDIISTPGLDGIYIGPADLALALGLPPQGDTLEPTHAAAVQRIAEACRKHSVAVGIHTSSLEFAQRYLGFGFNFVTLGSDAGFMARAAATDLAAARGTTAQTRERTGY
jgi:hypothetical protein